MDEAGYSPEVQIGLDNAWTRYVEEFERMKAATKLVPMEERPKGERPKVEAPLYSREQLLRFLDIEVDGPSSAATSQDAESLTWQPIDWSADEAEATAP